jgi:hypothetical protein
MMTLINGPLRTSLLCDGSAVLEKNASHWYASIVLGVPIARLWLPRWIGLDARLAWELATVALPSLPVARTVNSVFPKMLLIDEDS